MLWTDGRLIDRQRRPCHGPLYGANNSDVHGLVFSLCVIGHYQLREMRVHGGGYAVMRSEMH